MKEIFEQMDKRDLTLTGRVFRWACVFCMTVAVIAVAAWLITPLLTLLLENR